MSDFAASPGPLNGISSETMRTWRGIPYGQTTAGEHRWNPPKPYPSWEHIHDAHHFGNISPQPVYSWQDRIAGDEDCLNLDIVRPNTDEQLPVVVYFHGGSFIVGSSHQEILRGYNFVTDLNCVYVSINFRLGVFGYLDLSSLGSCTPNPALHDQLLALQWVKANIALFGGDPNNVTIMGESAGASAVLTLLTSPQAKGLFHKAIAQSTPAASFHTQHQSAFWAQRLVHYMAHPHTTTLDDLRQESAADLVRAGQSMLWRERSLSTLNPCYGPAFEEGVVPAHPLESMEAGNCADVPLLIGTNNDEFSLAKLFYLRATPRERRAAIMLSAYDPHHAPEVLSAYHGARSRADFAQMLTDAVFWAPSVRVAQAHAQHCTAGTWMYRFDYSPPVLRWLGMGAMHTTEQALIFNDVAASRVSGMHMLTNQQQFDEIRRTMQQHWGQFIHTGSVGSQWPNYDAATRSTMIFDAPVRVEQDPRGDVRQAWKDYDMVEWGRQQ